MRAHQGGRWCGWRVCSETPPPLLTPLPLPPPDSPAWPAPLYPPPPLLTWQGIGVDGASVVIGQVTEVPQPAAVANNHVRVEASRLI